MTTDAADERIAALLAWLSLPQISPGRLWDLVIDADPVEQWNRLRSGASCTVTVPAGQADAWRVAATRLDPAALLASHRAAGVVVTTYGDAAHPPSAAHDPHIPPALLWRGSASPTTVERPSVGIVGTRRASRYGIDLALRFGAELAQAGCCVVSGLALGIDAAAHRGALEASAGEPVAVVGSGLDVVYPKRNAGLWAELVSRGAIVSQHPLGTEPVAWRFPARNRVLAALSDVLLVVESHERGGALITAGIAGARGVPVLAVPGAVHSPGSRGTNRLIADGCQPCLDVDDVVEALALVGRPLPSGSSPTSTRVPGGTGAAGAPPAPGTPGAQVLDAVGWSPSTLGEVAAACPGLDVSEVALSLVDLVLHGVLTESDGRYERLAPS